MTLALRSKLFVPGSRPELFAKALAGAADALSFDLEDAVPESCKAQARDAVRELLRSHAVAGCDKTLIVRVNALGSEHFDRQDKSKTIRRLLKRLQDLGCDLPELAHTT